ncbi:ATP-grasp domain-containing protein [Streptomyces nogalater]|uniref:ATP-grasp domain-containing protein n=1 Tax=Streptomyces nogalater TaxID=38314 RepID=A0ABW0WJJ0_STRNO
MIALVNPVSSGVFLSAAFRERGEECLLVYDGHFAAAAEDGGPGRRVIHRDVHSTARLLRDLRVRHVVPGSEAGVDLAHRLAEHLDLPRNDDATASARCDKARMVKALDDAGIEVPRQALVTAREDLPGALDHVGLPVVAKPPGSSGSDGCRICRTEQEAAEHFRAIHHRSNLLGTVNEAVLVQEYLPGSQYLVATVSLDGQHCLYELSRSCVDERGGTPTRRYTISCHRLGPEEHRVLAYVYACLDALGIRRGAANTDVRLTQAGPRIIEVNARILGPTLDPDPYFKAFGSSQQHLLVESLLAPADFRRRLPVGYTPPNVMGKAFLRSFGSGVLRGIPGLEAVRRLPGFHSVTSLPEVGTTIKDHALTTGSTGIVYFVHEDEPVVRKSLAVLVSMEDAGALFDIAAV